MTNQTTKWSQLPFRPWINSVAISNDGSRVAGGTYIHDYSKGTTVPGYFETFAYDSSGTPLWRNKCSELDGVFAVGISGDGTTIVGGGLLSPTNGFLKIFEGSKGDVLFDSAAAGIQGRVSGVGVSYTGAVVAGAAGELYVFVKNGEQYAQVTSSTPAGDPKFETALGKVAAVALHPSGDWLAACNQKGQVLVATLENQNIIRTFLWQASPEPLNCNSQNGPTAPVPFLSIAIAAESDSFVVGGGDVVYYGSLAEMKAGTALTRYQACDKAAPVGPVNPAPNLRWVAISENGLVFAAVANRTGGEKGTGQLLLYAKGIYAAKVKVALPLSPNSVSLDREGKFIAVAVGYPVGTSASIYLFDQNGKQIWDHPTGDMNWPVAVSADGSSMVAGGDDGSLLYFLTQNAEKTTPTESLVAAAHA
jgi:WD40 repeat protein